MNKTTIIAECRANPDKIFHLLRENDFEKAKKLFGEEKICICCGYKNDIDETGLSLCGEQYRILLPMWKDSMQQLILAPDVLGYLESYGKEGE